MGLAMSERKLAFGESNGGHVDNLRLEHSVVTGAAAIVGDK